jgi:hypothetical protein
MLPIQTIALKFKMLELTEVDMGDLEPSNIDMDRARKIRATDKYKRKRDCELMANKITDICKCIRRARAVNEECGEECGDIFFMRAKALLKEGNYKIGKKHDPRG